MINGKADHPPRNPVLVKPDMSLSTNRRAGLKREISEKKLVEARQ